MYVLLFGIFIGFSMATSSQRQENIVKQINNMKTSFTVSIQITLQPKT